MNLEIIILSEAIQSQKEKKYSMFSFIWENGFYYLCVHVCANAFISICIYASTYMHVYVCIQV